MRASLYFLTLIYGFQACPALAGAWTQPSGHGLFIAQAGAFSSSSFFAEDGSETSQPTFRKWELQPYAEYGVRDWLTVGGSAYIQRVGQSGTSNHGIADPELFARVRLWQGKKTVYSLQPLIKLPGMFEHDTPPRGGSRSTDAELSLLVGRNLNILSPRDYSDMRVGYRVRGRGLNPQWRVDAAMGIFVTDKLQLIPAFRSVIATAYDENTLFREDGEQDYDLYKAELTAAYHWREQHWVQATLFDHVGGALTGAGRGFSIGFAEPF